ncbi:MAG: Uma2 family endonuclease [Aggregatilineales bacterium]
MAVTPRLQTIEDLIALPDSDSRYELHNGVIVEVGKSSRSHTKVGLRIGALLTIWLIANAPGGEITGADGTFELSATETRVPDAAYVSAEKAKTVPEEAVYYPFAPDLAVEVKSPSNTIDEMRDLALLYLRTGSRLVWMVDYKKRAIIVYRPGRASVEVTGDGVLDGYDVLPGLKLRLTDIFEVLEP